MIEDKKPEPLRIYKAFSLELTSDYLITVALVWNMLMAYIP